MTIHYNILLHYMSYDTYWHYTVTEYTNVITYMHASAGYMINVFWFIILLAIIIYSIIIVQIMSVRLNH